MPEPKEMTINASCEVNSNTQAHAAILSAKKMRLKAKENLGGVNIDLNIATKLEQSAHRHLSLSEKPERGMGNEFIPLDSPDVPAHAERLTKTDRVSIDASLDRVELIHNNGVLNLALDAAEALKVQNPIEQMLAHQMAALHRMSLDLMAQAGNTRDIVEKCRLINASSRLMDIYQKAMLTINKVRTGGQQIVTVQHVQISDGGQAVVNGAIVSGGESSKK